MSILYRFKLFAAAASTTYLARSDESYKRETLPTELSTNVVMLTCESAAHGGVCDVYLVGTKHGYPESCRQVRDVIQFLKPHVVFLELCARRSGILTPVKNNGRISEFHVAYQEAMKYGANVILGDRPIEITLGRVPVMATLGEMVSCLILRPLDTHATFLDIEKEELNDVDSVNRVILGLEKMVPSYVEIVVHERDRYMSTNLLKVASKHNSVVAVVGMGHLQGIQKNWKQPVDMEQLLQERGFAASVLRFINFR
ncbi:uncharacterized protein LOC131011397 isoform X1 [Salvia miltiorrhiza]|uniref:uncharacterized protein LOC131011397 isoform X1 n=1 Tax=Salvia miltiorrhiza TaxID=226208 RepID=UPI0025ACE7E4|nr:uncharacterized protein LOC131011397 isoform X1 [Salvia miltiorrhiza]